MKHNLCQMGESSPAIEQGCRRRRLCRAYGLFGGYNKGGGVNRAGAEKEGIDRVVRIFGGNNEGQWKRGTGSATGRSRVCGKTHFIFRVSRSGHERGSSCVCPGKTYWTVFQGLHLVRGKNYGSAGQQAKNPSYRFINRFEGWAISRPETTDCPRRLPDEVMKGRPGNSGFRRGKNGEKFRQTTRPFPF